MLFFRYNKGIGFKVRDRKIVLWFGLFCFFFYLLEDSSFLKGLRERIFF